MLHRPITFVAPVRQATLPAGAVRSTYRGLRRMGWSEDEAGNLAAHLAGLTASRRGWQIREVEGLLFIRALAERGRIAR
jgi:hypothetical protein